MKTKENISLQLRLGLFRHGKSSHDDREIGDIGRPLAPRGIAAPRAMGRMMAERRLLPDLVLCSPATRTRETWALAAAQLPHPPTVLEIGELYDFGDGSAVLEAIRAHGGEAPFLLAVGHNPALQLLAGRLAADGNARSARIAEKFPTAALALFSCPSSRWPDLDEASCTLTDFICPKDIMAD